MEKRNIDGLLPKDLHLGFERQDAFAEQIALTQKRSAKMKDM